MSKTDTADRATLARQWALAATAKTIAALKADPRRADGAVLPWFRS